MLAGRVGISARGSHCARGSAGGGDFFGTGGLRVSGDGAEGLARGLAGASAQDADQGVFALLDHLQLGFFHIASGADLEPLLRVLDDLLDFLVFEPRGEVTDQALEIGKGVVVRPTVIQLIGAEITGLMARRSIHIQ